MNLTLILGEENMVVVPSLSSSGSQEFWNSSAVENLFFAATTQMSKAIEMSEQIEEKEGRKNLGESFAAPSFSLGLSQDSSQSTPSEPSASVDVNVGNAVHSSDVVIDAVPVSVVPFSGTKAEPSEPKAKQKREKKRTMAVMSPFKERIVDPRSALTEDQNGICEWLFQSQRECNVRMKFTTTMGVQYLSEVFLKVFSREHTCIQGDVVKSPFRLFMKPEISFSLDNNHLPEEKSLKFSRRTLIWVFTVFFTIIRIEYIYLFVFNLRKPAYEAMDNSSDGAEFLDKYGAVFTPFVFYCIIRKVFFVRYLVEVGHPKAFDMANEDLTPRRINCLGEQL
ncbi:hypothetical protein LXL04_015887 [Taraxacum kok-saghyz]